MEANKKREAEFQRLRRDLEESSVQSEALAASLKRRHSEAVAELSERCEALQRTRTKLEKEKQNLRMEVDDLAASLDSLQKAKVRRQRGDALTDLWFDRTVSRLFFMLQMSSDSQIKKLEEQLSEANRRGDELQRTVTELSVAKNRLLGTLIVFMSPQNLSIIRFYQFLTVCEDFFLHEGVQVFQRDQFSALRLSKSLKPVHQSTKPR